MTRRTDRLLRLRLPEWGAAVVLAGGLLLGTTACSAVAPAPVSTAAAAFAADTGRPQAVRTPTATPTPTPTVVVTTETVTETAPVVRGSRSEDDPNADQGTSTFAAGADGVLTRSFEVVKHDGVEVSRSQTSEAVTTAPVDDVTRVGVRAPAPAPVAAAPAAAAGGCDSNYTGPCVPIDSDVDCAGGSGNGPSYVSGPVTVVGSDVYDLDRDGDGIACD